MGLHERRPRDDGVLGTPDGHAPDESRGGAVTYLSIVAAACSSFFLHMYVQLEMRAQHTLWRKISGAHYARGISGARVNRVGISGWGCERIGRNLCFSTDL